jgi:hypothetical protein
MKVEISLLAGFGFAITTNRGNNYSFAIIFLCFVIVFKRI